MDNSHLFWYSVYLRVIFFFHIFNSWSNLHLTNTLTWIYNLKAIEESQSLYQNCWISPFQSYDHSQNLPSMLLTKLWHKSDKERWPWTRRGCKKGFCHWDICWGRGIDTHQLIKILNNTGSPSPPITQHLCFLITIRYFNVNKQRGPVFSVQKPTFFRHCGL